jgi:hypothetical protein
MYRKSTLAKGLSASFGTLLLVGALVMATGTAYAMPLAGIGGFTIQAEEIRADSAVIYPGSGDTSEQGAYPMAVIEQKGVEIDGLKLIKELDVSAIPGLSGNARIVMSSSETVEADQQLIKVSNIQAEQATFNAQVIDEHDSNDATRKFDIKSGSATEDIEGRTVSIDSDGPAQVLKNAKIRTHYLATNSISLPGLELDIQYDQDGDGVYQESGSGSDGSGA